MQIFQDQTFHRFVDDDSAALFSDIEFRRCHFKGCLVSITNKPNLRSTIRNVSVIDCTENGGSIGTAIVEDVLVQHLKAPGLFQTFGAVFNRVVLHGRFERLMITNDVLPSVLMDEEDRQREIDAFRLANAEYYRNVDWALDISQGEFKEFEIRGIPSWLIRRDPETQVVVTKKRLLEGDDWRELAFDGPWHVGFHLLLDSPCEDTIVIAPKRHRKFPLYMADLELLREAGIAEPD